MNKILIVEDELTIAELEKDYLELSRFEVEIETSGERGLERALKEDFDLFILDVMLPNVDGFEICRRVREVKNTPILLVSAKKDDIDKIRGLGLGADDYMTKPFSPSELVARVKAHLARYERLIGSNVQENEIIEIRGIKIDKTARRVYVNGEEKNFTTKNVWEMGEMLHFAVQQNIPTAIRYPRGKAYEGLGRNKEPICAGKGEWIVKGKEIALLAIGSMVETAIEVRELLKREGVTVSVINARFAKPLDEEMLCEVFKAHSVIVTMEEGIQSGGFGEAVAAWHQDRRTFQGQLLDKEAKVCIIALPDKFIEHGSVKELKKKYHLDAESIAKKVKKAYGSKQYR